MEPTTINNIINAIKEVRELFNERRSNLSRKETKRIREKLYKLYRKEAVYNFLKEKEQKDGLNNKEKMVLKSIDKYFKNPKNLKNLKKLKEDLEKLQKYQYNITYGLNYLFNEEDYYYEPKEIKSALMVVICYMKAKEIKIIN